MKKVLGIVGSPRKRGNTHILVSRILEGAESEGASTDIIFLKGMKIRECDGCHVCWEGKDCNKKDDMLDIYPKLINSDVLVFGTPVYWFGPTALMKAFLDRFVYFTCPENENKIKGKKVVLVVPFEDTDMETAAPLVAMFEKSFDYLEMNLVGTILVPGVGETGAILGKTEYLEEGYQLGKSLA